MDLPDPENNPTEIEKSQDKETGYSAVKDERYTLYECHLELDLPGFEDKKDGIALPYVVTMLSTGEVLGSEETTLKTIK